MGASMKNGNRGQGYREFEQRRKQRLAALSRHCRSLFPQATEITLEIGSGHGHFLTAFAAAVPARSFVGLDLINRRLEKSQRKRERARLDNLTFLKAEATEFLNSLPAQVRVEECYVIYPDPWPKKRHHKNRLIQPAFLTLLAGRMIAKGRLNFRTDHVPYFEWCEGMVDLHRNWRVLPEVPWGFEQATIFGEMLSNHRSLVAERVG